MTLLPWEADAALPGLDDGAFEYPRTVTFLRPCKNTTPGAQPEREYNDTGSSIVGMPLVPCSIQFDRDGGSPLIATPGSARARGAYRIFISATNATAFGIGTPEAVTVGDTAVDDQAIRYQVTHPWWDSMGWQVKAERLK
jgi:hypothetical protein